MVKKNIQSRLNEKSLSYLVNLLAKFTKVIPIGAIRSSKMYEFDQILDTIVDSLYIDNISAIEYYQKHKLSRSFLRAEVRHQLANLLSNQRSDGKLKRFLITQLKTIAKKKKSEKSFYYVFPQNIELRDAIGKAVSLKYKNYIFELYDYSFFIKTKFNNNKVRKLIEERCSKNSLMKTHFTLFILKVKGHDPEYLMDYAEKIFTEVLALFNLSKYIHVNSQTYGNKLYAISPVKFPPVFFKYDNKKKFKNYYFSDNLPYEKHIVFKKENYKIFVANTELICDLPKKGALNRLIFENLRLYQEGISELKLNESCFSLWNAIEGVTKINENGHVPKRANSILKRPSPKWRLKLEVLREKRNKFAHKSIKEFVASDQLFLKKVSEELFVFLINHSKMLKSLSDLELLYITSSKNTQQLKNKLSVTIRELELIKYLLKERGKRGPKWLNKLLTAR